MVRTHADDERFLQRTREREASDYQNFGR